MLILKTEEEFKNIFRTGKKWIRCQEAMINIPNIKANQFHSIGDSLAYLLDDGSFPHDPRFIGHRRYMDIYYISEGSCTLEYALKKSLKIIESYSDESDCEYLEGRGEPITLEKGNIIILEASDAHRITASAVCRKLIIKLTVEDNTFLNK